MIKRSFFCLFCFVSIQINCSSTTEAGVYETLTAVPDDYYRRPYFYGISCKKRFNSCCLTFSGLSPVSYVTYTYLILAKLLWLRVLCVCFHCQVSVAITLNHSYYMFKSFLFFFFFFPSEHPLCLLTFSFLSMYPSKELRQRFYKNLSLRKNLVSHF